MTNREWLSRAINIDKEIQALEIAKERAFGVADYASPSFSERVQTGQSNSIESKVITYTDYASQIDKALMALVQVKSEVLATINTLEDTVDRTLLIERFINGKDFYEIADIVGYQTETVKQKIIKASNKINIPVNT